MTIDEALKVWLPVIQMGVETMPECKEALDMAIKALEQEPKTGEWIEHFDESGKWYECDQCHTDWGGAVNFCPNCGADMREVEE